MITETISSSTARSEFSSEFTVPATRPLPKTSSGLQPRILYVDDDPVLRRIGEQVLVRAGFAVDTAADGEEGWAALHQQHYRLLITDNQMPRLSGLELIHKVRHARMALPVILASGTVGTLPEGELLPLQCGATLAKPFTPDQLISSVREVLRKEPDSGTYGFPLVMPEELATRCEPCSRWGINE